ncbi:hypothetical protein PR048_005010 [Dryococelus australis]|uniref:Uncharacterized protein n=1 Tax=Dryococelus australis TaxID=614101 RepID=A0ABQ9I721_9NEOP|nr:hypothetical protein PR048_005010 [Dryococelus australis]
MLSILSGEDCFEDLKTLPGTRNFHNFRLLDCSGTSGARRVNIDEKPSLTYNFREEVTSNVKEEDLYLFRYTACTYDNHWYFGIITDVTKEGDVTVKFLHPAGPSPLFYWPK